VTVSRGAADDLRYAASGQVWREYDITPFTVRRATERRPGQPIVDYILRQTGPELWHGDEPASLSATRAKLRVYHAPEVQQQVAEFVERFVRPPQRQVSLRLHVVSTTELNWRTGVMPALSPVLQGPQGQHVWLLAPEDASLVRQKVRSDRLSRGLYSEGLVIENGVEAVVETSQPVNYIQGIDLVPSGTAGYQPIIGRLSDGVRLTLTPLWTLDGRALDLDLGVTTAVVQNLHAAAAAAPLTSGSQMVTVQVPETTSSHLRELVRWPVDKTLLLSAGVQRGLGGPKRSARLMSALTPPAELLIFAEVTPPLSASAPVRRSYRTVWQPIRQPL
jgi:hypothetical protein